MTMNRFLAAAVMSLFVVSGCDCGPRKPPVDNYGQVGIVFEQDGVVITHPTEATYDFGKVPMGTSPKLKVTIQNRGRAALDLQEVVKLEGANLKLGDTLNETPAVFELAFTPTTLAASESVDFELVFNSPVEADASVLTRDWLSKITLRIGNVEPGSETATITFKGTAIAGNCVLPTTIDFGAVMLQDTVKQTVKVNNTSPLQVTASVGAITSNSGDHNAFGFAAESITGEASIPAGSSRDIALTFKPTDVHDYLALVKARAAAECPEVTIKLVGSGVNSVLTCDPTPLDFGYLTPGLTVQKELTLTNQGLAPIQMTNLATRIGTNPSTEYKLLGANMVTVPGATRTNGTLTPGQVKLQLTFTPANLGLRNGALVGTTTLAPQPMLSCPLRGTGGGPDIDIKPAAMNFGKVPYFAQAPKPFHVSRKVTIRNLGTRPMPADPNANLKLGTGGSGTTPWTVTAKNPDSDLSLICVGVFDEMTNTCQPGFPAGYDPAVGLEAIATAFLDVPIRITPNAPNKNLEWDVTFNSNDPDEPAIVVNVKAQSVELPPCNYTVTPTSLNFGLVTPPQYRDLSFQIRNLGMNMNETCLITHLEMKAGSNAIFTLPAGELDQVELQPGQVQNVTVRAWPMGNASATVNQVMGNVTFGISSPTNPTRDVSLTASIATACLTITPNDLDFGTVQKNCNSPRRTFSIYNTCPTAVTVQSYGMLAAAGVQPGTMYCPGPMPCPEFLIDGTPSFGAGTSITSGSMPHTFAIRYKPLDDGPDTGAFLLKVVQNGQVVDYVVTLRGAGDNMGLNTDTFRQDSKPKADILLVIDDSCSMFDKQVSMGTNFGSFIRYANSAAVDYHIAVIPTEINAARASRFIGAPNNNGPANGGCPGYSGPKVLTPQTPNVENLFRQVTCVGTSGGYEGMACQAVTALTAPFITDPQINGGFLRPDAILAVVAVTDADEQCPAAATVYENQLRNIKGAQNANLFSYNVIGPFLPSSPSGCSYDCGSSCDVSKHNYLVNAFNGVKDEICTPNWATTLENLGKIAFGFRTNFFLTAEPDLTGGKTITVKMDDGMGGPLTVVDPVDPRGAPVWSYDSVSNSVVFQPLFVPAPGQVMTITYYVACL